MATPNDNNRERSFDEAVRQFVEAQLSGYEPDIEDFVSKYSEFEHQLREKIKEFQQVDSLFDTLVQADESDFANAVTEPGLVGQKIGNFEIAEMIGRGGMGVVYLARDTKLKRSVAIKSLPAALAADSTARTRFRREAELLASLNHPNIAVIHEIIEEEKSGYLVLEYVPGQTLAERIAKGPLKPQEALTIALQIAEAVAAAHEHDVIHRDLKPGNIKITPDGRVKVLDFGLAKAVGGKAVEQQSTVTQPGRVVGTPAYMSPEQACGKPTDECSDIWSFGCLLYEMLTGHPPFESETATEILARIIERKPDWERLPQDVPMNIRVLLRRCLEKDPRRRLRDIGDAAIEIDETLNVPADGPIFGEPVVEVARRRLWWLGIVCGAAGIVVGLIAARIFLGKPAGPSPTAVTVVPRHRTVIRLPEGQVLSFSTTQARREPAFALSPDGSRLVYVARFGDTTQLFERLMNEFEFRPIPGTEGAAIPFFSPDGRSVGFYDGGNMRRISLLGGEPVTVCQGGYSGASWGSDGMIYFIEALEGHRLFRVSVAGGEPEPLSPVFDTSVSGPSYPQLLPGGKAVLISSGDGVALYSLETTQSRILVPDGRYPRYAPTGHLVYQRAGVIEAVSFNLATLEVTGRPVPVLEGALLDSRTGIVQSAFSDNGVLVYAPGGDVHRTIPVWVDHQGNVEPLAMRPQIYGALRLSPDGRKLAITVRDLFFNISVYDIDRGTKSRLTTYTEGSYNYPLWTPDGERIVFMHRPNPNERLWHLLLTPADGIGEAELLYSGEGSCRPYSWSPDGRWLAFYEARDVFVLSMEGRGEPERIIEMDASCWDPAFSPDGRYMACTSNRGGTTQIYVHPYPATMDWSVRISLEHGEEPIWSPNGDKLFYRNLNKWMVVSISTEPEFTAGTPQVVFQGPYLDVSGPSYDIGPDGRFLVLKPQYDDSQVSELHVVTNWFEELKQLVPLTIDQ